MANAAASRAPEHSLASRAPPELATPTEPQIARLLSRCREALGTSHAPTFAATRAAVEAMATPKPRRRRSRGSKQQSEGGGAATSGGGGGDGNGDGGGWPGGGDEESGWEHTSGEQLALSREAALLVVTEYLMLHLGKTKWRARKWRHAHPVPARATAVVGGASDEGEAVRESEKGAEGEEDEEGSEDEEDEEDEEGGEGEADVSLLTSSRSDGCGEGCTELLEAKVEVKLEQSGQPLETEVTAETKLETAEAAEAAEPVPLASPCVSSELTAGATTTASEPPCARLPEVLLTEVNSEEIDIDDVPTGEPSQSAQSSEPCAEVLVQVQASLRQLSSSATLPSRLAVRGGGLSSSAVSVAAGSAVSPWHGTLRCLPLDTTDRAAVGRWGEALVYNYLLATLPPERAVTWLNRTEETRAPYDLTICERGKSAHRGGGGTRSSGVSVFVEVKTTRYRDSNVFDLSYFEWEFMSHEPPVQYHIYHVTSAGDPAGAKITIIEDPVQAMKDDSTRLCMAV